MGALATLPLPRLVKLLPMLASDFDGEVVATVRAIGRVLRDSGCDWHDLTRAITGPVASTGRSDEAPNHGPQSPSRPARWRSLDRYERVIALDGILALDLSPWELSFARSIAATLRANPSASFTTKQVQVLDRLLAAAWEVYG